MAAIIETRKLTKKFGDFTAVDGLDVSVQEGEIFGLLGPNGAGKSTTLLMLTTLIKPTSGSAMVNGFDVMRQPVKVRQSQGIVFQDPSSDDILTGYENLKLHGMLYDMPAALREERIREVLALVDLTDRQHSRVREYSGGMRRRLELARGLMHQPRVLFLDEPTLGLDPQSREHLWHYIEKLSREKRISIVITTHYMEEVERLCDKMVIIDRGRVVVAGTPEGLKSVVGGDVIRIGAPDIDEKALRQLPFVKKVELQDGAAQLTVTDAAANLPEVLRHVPQAESVQVRRPTLNDVFLHYTGREIREESAEGGWGSRAMNYEKK